MDCEGIWKVEMKGPYGWERVATAFMQNGQYLAASANHYSRGTYTLDGDKVKIKTVVHQYGDVRSIFGKKSFAKMQMLATGKLQKNKIAGTIRAKGVKKFDILIRFTLLDAID